MFKYISSPILGFLVKFIRVGIMNTQSPQDLQPGQIVMLDGASYVVQAIPNGVELAPTSSKQASPELDVVPNSQNIGSNEDVS